MNTFNNDSHVPEKNESAIDTASLNAEAQRLQDMKKETLFEMMKTVEPLRLLAAEQLMKSSPEWSDLFHIMFYVPELRERAWQQLLLFENDKPFMRNYALRTVIINIPEYRGVAARMQMDGKPEVYDLPVIMQYLPAYAEEAWKMLLTNEFDTRDYEEIIHHVPEYAEKAARIYLDKAVSHLEANDPHPVHLEAIMRYFPALCDEAWQKICMCDYKDKYVFKKVIENFPDKAEQARLLLEGIPKKDR